FEVLTDVSGNELTITVDENGTSVVYRVLAGVGLACADKAYRPLFLSPTPGGTRTLRSYETDLRYMCIRFKDPSSGQPTWFCGAGTLGDGVPGYALKNNSPRPFLAGGVTWGDNTWTRHYEFLGGLGAIPERITAVQQNGFSFEQAWGLNPRDAKQREYLAAIA